MALARALGEASAEYDASHARVDAVRQDYCWHFLATE
jgi:hypothetical protein